MLKNHLVLITYSLLIIGVIFLSTGSLFEAQANLGDQLIFFKKQIGWVLIGSIFFLLFSQLPFGFIQKIATPLYLVSIILLLFLFIPGFSSKIFGANRWLNLGPLSFQPTEFYKFTSLLFFPNLFSKKTSITQLAVFGLPPALLILFQPALSSTILTTAIIVTIYFFSQQDVKSLSIVLLSLLLMFTLSIVLSPYRLKRLTTNYHQQQLTISLGSGSLFGKGIGNSTQKFKFIPQISTDSILAIIGEETGFMGMTFLLSLFYLLIKIIIDISLAAKSNFQKLFSIGLASWIFYQSAINISVVSGLIPLTGISLPLVSYGGSSLLTLMSALGIVNNINNHV